MAPCVVARTPCEHLPAKQRSDGDVCGRFVIVVDRHALELLLGKSCGERYFLLKYAMLKKALAGQERRRRWE